MMRPASLSRHLRNRVDQRQEFVDVVPISRGYRERQRYPSFPVGQKMVFRPIFTSVHGTRSRFFPRCIARTDVESTTARDQSILPACWSFSRSVLCRRSQTPAFFSRAVFASRSCPSRNPFRAAGIPREPRCGAHTRCPSKRVGRRWAFVPGAAAFASWAEEEVVRSTSIARH